MALTRILRGASSSANPLVSVSMAPFVEAYSRAPATGCEPTIELRLMMLPPLVPNRLIGACTVGGIVHGHARARSSQGRCNPTAYAFGCARHYCHFIRQSAHIHHCS